MRVAPDVAQRGEEVVAAAPFGADRLARQQRRRDQDRKHAGDPAEPGEIGRGGACGLMVLQQRRAQREGQEQPDRGSDLARSEYPRAFPAFEGQLRTERELRDVEGRVGRVEAEDRDAHPERQLAGRQALGRGPQHEPEARHRQCRSEHPGATPAEPRARAVAQESDERVGDGIPQLRQEEDRTDGRGRHQQDVGREVHVHHEDEHVEEVNGDRREAVEPDGPPREGFGGDAGRLRRGLFSHDPHSNRRMRSSAYGVLAASRSAIRCLSSSCFARSSGKL